MNLDDVAELPTVLSAEPVAELLGVSTDLLYRLVRDEPEALPVQPFRLGRTLRWPTAPLLAALGLQRDEAPAHTADASHHPTRPTPIDHEENPRERT